MEFLSSAGVLLSNLGTPDAPTRRALRRYLKQFLWDRRVIEVSRPLWWFLLHAVVLPRRPKRSAEAYEKVWTPEGSPLLILTRKQAAGLEQRLGVPVAAGMRYGNPSIEAALSELESRGCTRVLLFPLYPQYSAATSASTFDETTAVLRRRRFVPELRTVHDYHDDPGYLDALAASFRDAWGADGPASRVLLSFHGIPKRYAEAGDPYPRRCEATARLLSERLGVACTLAYQSRFGREEWLKPYTDETLIAWGREGLDSVDVACPGFPADCLETLEEIAMTNRASFQAAGGGRFRYLPALNDRPDHLDALAAIARRNLGGWLE